MIQRPTAGWTPNKITDLRQVYGDDYPRGRCELCGRDDLRFEHELRHPRLGMLTVGGQCAANLVGGYDATERENRLRNQFAVKQRFLAQGWKTSRSGNRFRKYHGVCITIFHHKFHRDRFTWCVATSAGRREYGAHYETEAEAREAVFYQLEAVLGEPIWSA